LKRFLTIVVLAAGPLLAEESGSSEKPGGELWKWLNFLILAGIVGYMAVKLGGPALRARSNAIQEALAAGEKAKAEADAHAREIQGKLANLETEIAAMKTSAREERDREASRIQREAQLEMARIHHQVEMEIESAGKLARLDVQRFAAKLAVDLAERKIRARMTPEVQDALLDSFVNDFPRNGVKNARTS
jgi:F-type H+-transporting ATPase subunit b